MSSGAERMQDAGRAFADAAQDTAGNLAKGTKDAAPSEIAALRKKGETLMAERVASAVSKATEQGEALAHDASAMIRQRAGEVASTAREQPFAAIGASVLAGLAICLLMRR